VEFADAFNDFFYRSIEKNHDEALKLVNQAISLAYTRDDLARCLRNKGYTLGELRRDKEAINVYTQLIEGFGGTESDKIKSELAKARINMGFLLVRNNEYAEAVRIYDQAIDEIRSDNDASLFELLSHAYVNKFESVTKTFLIIILCSERTGES
jgi:tetratricopeptide (TPR) repeat protein